MISRNLRHFRVFLAVATLGSPTAAAERARVSQPAVTQAIGKLEAAAGGPLFARSRQGFFLTERGRIFEARIRRAMTRLDAALAEVSPRLAVTATASQLRALIATAETLNFTLAARNLGLAQPTVHRAVAQIEQEAARPLFERSASGLLATRACRDLAQAARLAFSEFAQAEADLAEFDGREAGGITLGALPLARSVLLPGALARFRARRLRQRVTVLDGPYDEMLNGVRRGDIDLMIGALRDPAPVDDIAQETLFLDRIAIVARPGHPLAAGAVAVETLARQGWVVPRPGTPSRAQFDALFADRDLPPPDSVLDCGSILLMRELLARSDLLGCISAQQAEAEIANGLLTRLETGLDWPGRPIGLTCRKGWVPTRAQALLIDLIRETAARLASPEATEETILRARPAAQTQ